MVKLERIHWLLIISFFLALFDFAGFLGGLRGVTVQVVLPVKQSVYNLSLAVRSLGVVMSEYPQIADIAQNNLNLKKTNEELKIQVRALTDDNAKLRSQLGAPLPPSFQFALAHVVSISRYMEVDVGTNESVKPGMSVVDGISLVGRVLSVSSNRSQVILPFDPDFSIPGKTSRATAGLVVGQGNNVVILDKVLQKDPLFLDDTVVTSGAGGLPSNLLIGKISHITSDDVSPYKQAKISPVIDYSKETLVFIITSI